MQLASRSYLAAGVALVGAGAIAVSPMAPPVPDVHIPVALTAAIENPVTVFEPAFAATQTLISNIIERQTTNPLPVLRQLATNVATGVQVFANTDPVLVVALALTHGVITAQEIGPNLIALGETTSSAMNALIENLGVLAAGLPDALQAAGALIAAGDPNGAINAIMGPGVQPIINIMLETVNPSIGAVGHVLGVPQPIIDAATESTLGLLIAVASATVGIGFDLPGYPLPLVKQVIAGTQSVLAAAASGDPGTFVNAVQHSVADFAADVAYQVDQTISMGNYIADSFANALKQITPKPVPFPDIELPKALAAPAAIAPTTAITTELEPTTKPAEETLSTPVTKVDNASGTESGTSAPTAETTATDAASTDGDDTAPVATKASTKASPKAAKGQSKANAAKAVRDQVKSSVKKLTDGLKKDKVGAEKGAAKKADSAKGADND
ncbi:hypothetical protein A5717_19955 [Mycolicibacterium porcinum]|uniref:hypothetical protein n=1 Tax=Mycolicibacterium porcinum TaxID=39693 RepID=UPI00080B087B|nr:hypothetical protein [Mycolicibacterium porcinum]OCB11461.1 hypothetical protein A5717_19955 [Mycolicibacterium porcinum]